MSEWAPHPLLWLYRTTGQTLRSFLAEVCVQEGYLASDHKHLDAVDDLGSALAGRAAVIVSPSSTTPREDELLADYVHTGGAVVLIDPPTSLVTTLGLRFSQKVHPVYHAAPAGYSRLAPHPWTAHHTEAVLQVLVPCALRKVEGERPLAMIAARRDQPSTYPSVIEADCGNGRVVVFWFELGTSLVHSRQGNAHLATTGLLGNPTNPRSYKPGNLFAGLLDPDLREVPQADVWTDVFVAILRGLTDSRLPLARVWQFPANAPALTLLDGDSDAYDWDCYQKLVEPALAAGVPYTLNLMEHHLRALDLSAVESWQKRGQDFQLHYWPHTRTPTVQQMRTAIHDQQAVYSQMLGRPAVGGERAHTLIWPGFVDTAAALADAGLRMETNFLPYVGYQFGYFGSARAARYFDSDGFPLRISQQPMAMMDEAMACEHTLVPPTSPDEAYAIARRLYESAATRYHGAVCTCLHPVPETHPERYRSVQTALRQAIIDATRLHHLPALTTSQWSAFHESRRDMDLRYESGSWQITATAPLQGCTVHLPALQRRPNTSIRQGLAWYSWELDLVPGRTVRLLEESDAEVSAPRV